MGLSKLLRSAPARPTWLGCQSAWLHFRSVLTAKDLKFRFHTSALPWLPKTWCSASTFPLCLDWQRSEVPRPHFRSALTAKNVKFLFRIRTSALPLLPNMWSSSPALPLCLYWQRSEVPFSALVLPGLPKMWSSASAFHLCLDFRQTQWWPRHKAIYFSWFGPELFCLLLGPPGFNCWFSSAPVFQWCCSTPQGSPGVGRNTFLSSPHLCFIIVFNCDLFVSRDDPLMS